MLWELSSGKRYSPASWLWHTKDSCCQAWSPQVPKQILVQCLWVQPFVWCVSSWSTSRVLWIPDTRGTQGSWLRCLSTNSEVLPCPLEEHSGDLYVLSTEWCLPTWIPDPGSTWSSRCSWRKRLPRIPKGILPWIWNLLSSSWRPSWDRVLQSPTYPSSSCRGVWPQAVEFYSWSSSSSREKLSSSS